MPAQASALYIPEELREFHASVREFLDTHLPLILREASRATPTVFAEPDIGRQWQRILHAKGWLGYNWPR